MAPVYAIKDTATGDVSLKDGADKNAGVAWSYRRGGGYMATPLAYRGVLYVVTYNGVLTAYDAKTGEEALHPAAGRRHSAFTASPVAADGKVYFASEDGRVFVLKADPVYQLIATNEMGESTLATPALFRGNDVLAHAGALVAVGDRDDGRVNPKSKLQIPTHSQLPTANSGARGLGFGSWVGIWKLGVRWPLGFGIWDLIRNQACGLTLLMMYSSTVAAPRAPWS